MTFSALDPTHVYLDAFYFVPPHFTANIFYHSPASSVFLVNRNELESYDTVLIKEESIQEARNTVPGT